MFLDGKIALKDGSKVSSAAYPIIIITIFLLLSVGVGATVHLEDTVIVMQDVNWSFIDNEKNFSKVVIYNERVQFDETNISVSADPRVEGTVINFSRNYKEFNLTAQSQGQNVSVVLGNLTPQKAYKIEISSEEDYLETTANSSGYIKFSYNDLREEQKFKVELFELRSADWYTIEMKYSIESNTEDKIVIDNTENPSEGNYSSSSLDFGYISSEYDGILAGIVNHGGYFNVTFANHTSNYTFKIRQPSGDSEILIPFTEGDYKNLESRESLIKSGSLLNYPNPCISYTLSGEKTVKVILNYQDILLRVFTGNLAPGSHTLYVTKAGEEGKKAEVEVKR